MTSALFGAAPSVSVLQLDSVCAVAAARDFAEMMGERTPFGDLVRKKDVLRA